MKSSDTSRKPVIGLIGGIGSGKSAVAAEFARHGGRIISGDALGHEALRQPAIRGRVVERFGRGILGPDGEIVRRELGRIVFADPIARRDLEGLVFPYIEARIRDEIEAAQSAADMRFVLLDAAIMLETGWNKVCDWLVYIHVPRAMRLDRLQRQRGWSEKEVTAREQAQIPLTDKASHADFTVDNSGALAETGRQVYNLLQHLGLVPSSKSD
ncbi:MAG: dephospho-CoA kinase [Planctomycetia bacterium]|nr:dephospho-CoA kinase [Planctomycetia bacterium]